MRLLVVIPPLPGPGHWLSDSPWYLREENHAAPDSTPMPPHFAPAILGVVRRRMGSALTVKVMDGMLEPLTPDEVREAAIEFGAEAAFVLAGLDLLTHDCAFADLPCPVFVQITPVTIDPDEALDLYDLPGDYFLHGGETETTLAEAISRLDTGQGLEDCPGLVIKGDGGWRRTAPPGRSDMESFAPPAYDLFDYSAYLARQAEAEPDVDRRGSALLKTMKGCLYSCVFCTCSTPGQTARYKSVSQVVDELRLLRESYGVSRVVFIDPEFGVDLSRAKAVCRGIIEAGLNLGFSICNRVELMDEELVALLVAAGCEGIRYGIETADPAVMKRIDKRVDLVRASESIRATRGAGLPVNLFFLVGLPGETRRTIRLNARFIVENQADSYSMGRLFLIPNTKLYDQVKAEGRLIETDWERYRLADSYQFRHDYYPDLESIKESERRLNNLVNRKRLTSYRMGGLNLRLYLFLSSFSVFSIWLKKCSPRLYGMGRDAVKKFLRV